MEAAFVDIGKGRNAVLYAGEVNFDLSGLEGQPKRIESALKAGQSVIVQVTKDPMGHKGARLTSQVSLPGRYLVYVPGSSMTGISRKLPDVERNRLKQILKQVMPENGGVIVRTAAEGAAEDELSRDVSRLAAQWEAIEKKSKTASAPALLYSEPDLTIRVIRDVFNEDFSSLVVSGDEGWDVVDEYVRYVAPHLADRLTRWQEDRDVFGVYRIDEQLAKALERKVWLPSGGSLVIDKTEAMTVIDVNTGKFTGQGGNLEETVTRNNLEAAEEIVRQLRLRDVGGIVVIDFIDMVLESNRELVLRRLLECLARDRTKHQVAEVTSLGLVQMTRKRVGAGLLEAFSQPCECCNGRGVIITYDPEADGQSAHHVHARGAGNGGNGARSAPATPAAIAARPRPADVQPIDAPAPDGSAPDGQGASVSPDSEPAGAAQAPNGRGEPGRSGNGRRRRRRPAASAVGPSASPASHAPAAPEASAAPPVAVSEHSQPQDGAA
jgi:ribonuclease E